MVSDINHNTTIQLPTTFSCETIPAKRQQIPSPEMVKPWRHLHSIARYLVPLQTDINVGLLIGSNCPQAIMPREVIPGKSNEPYAQRTDLGSGVIGNVGGAVVNEDNDSSSITHAIKPSIKEVINPVQFREMLESDFSEKSAGQPLSLDDKRFLSQMEQGIRQREDGHYEMPLPFRRESPVMPTVTTGQLHCIA